MVTLCWAAKGGSGTTVVTAMLALETPRPSLLVDLAGEAPAVLGLPEPDRPGVVDWLIGHGPSSQLFDLVDDIDATTALLPRRSADQPPHGLSTVAAPRWAQLVAWLGQWEQEQGGDVWIDHGTGHPHAEIADLVTRRLLVTRPCFLALRRAARSTVRPTGVVLVAEPGRSLRARDVEQCLGVPIVASVAHDPKLARAVDCGLLAGRPPFGIRRELRRLAA